MWGYYSAEIFGKKKSRLRIGCRGGIGQVKFRLVFRVLGLCSGIEVSCGELCEDMLVDILSSP